jgi:hypothetical protein
LLAIHFLAVQANLSINGGGSGNNELRLPDGASNENPPRWFAWRVSVQVWNAG